MIRNIHEPSDNCHIRPNTPFAPSSTQPSLITEIHPIVPADVARTVFADIVPALLAKSVGKALIQRGLFVPRVGENSAIDIELLFAEAEVLCEAIEDAFQLLGGAPRLLGVLRLGVLQEPLKRDRRIEKADNFLAEFHQRD